VDEKQFEAINAKLSIIIKLLSTQMIRDADYRNQVNLLHTAGLSNKDIATLTGKTENNVKVTLHFIKKSKRK